MLILPTAYLAPVQHYALLCGDCSVVEDRGEHFVKQTCRNRCRILGARGVETLVVPVEHSGPHGATHTPVHDIRISKHEPSWQRRHWHALRTAYNSTPFFEYYADDFAPIYERPYTFLCDWNADLEHLVLILLGLEARKQVSGTYITPAADDIDLRQVVEKHGMMGEELFHTVPYWQLWAPQGTFVPGLSIVDLLFNMGTEARLVLKASLAAEALQTALPQRSFPA